VRILGRAPGRTVRGPLVASAPSATGCKLVADVADQRVQEQDRKTVKAQRVCGNLFGRTEAAVARPLGTCRNLVTDSGHFVITGSTTHFFGDDHSGLQSGLFGRDVSPQFVAKPF
jgi:hypothetical protein